MISQTEIPEPTGVELSLEVDILDLPKYVLFGNEVIELDASMFKSGLCAECESLGYCKKGIGQLQTTKQDDKPYIQ